MNENLVKDGRFVSVRYLYLLPPVCPEEHIGNGSEQVQRHLNQKVCLKFYGAVDFTLRFIFLINFKVEIRTFSNYY
jgi:hypothetical protein